MRGLSLKDAPFLAGTMPSLTPASFSILAWFKADDYSQSDGTILATNWTDHGSEASNAIIVAGKEPVFKTNIFGSMPSVRFSANKILSRTLKSYGYSGATTFAWVTKNISATSFGLTSRSTDVNNYMTVNQGNANQNFYNPDSSGVLSSVITETVASARVNYFVANGQAVSFRVNKTAYGSGTGPTNSINVDRLGYDAVLATVDIGEICFWNGALTTTNMDNLYDLYFKPRWGLP